MKQININNIVGTEVLAKDIISETGTTLMIAGTTIKKEYAEKLEALNINYVYVMENYHNNVTIEDVIEQKIKEQCQEKVKETIELYASYGIEELKPIIGIANSIITDVLQDKEVIYNICGIRERSESNFAHCVNVCALSVLIAIRMKVSEERIKDIAIGCLLHDIGITYYANKSQVEESEVNEETWAEYKNHVIYGYSMVNVEKWLSPTSKDIILLHHERLDGSGYPMGLTGKKLKKAVRIVAVCDTFDRMVYGLSGKKYKVHEAIDFIVSKAEILFDLSVVNMFLHTVAAYPNGSVVTTNRGDRAIVVRQNRKFPTRPVIREIIDRDGESYIGDIEIDLVKNRTLFILETEL